MFGLKNLLVYIEQFTTVKLKYLEKCHRMAQRLINLGFSLYRVTHRLSFNHRIVANSFILSQKFQDFHSTGEYFCAN